MARKSKRKLGRMLCNSVLSVVLEHRVGKISGRIDVYDPYCGPGEVLRSVAERLGRRKIRLFGQDRSRIVATRARAALAGCCCGTADIGVGDPILSPFSGPRKFDVAVSNLVPLQGTAIRAPRKDKWRRFDGYRIPTRNRYMWQALICAADSVKPGGCGVCLLTKTAVVTGLVGGGVITQLYRKGFVETTVEVPNFAKFVRGLRMPEVRLVMLKGPEVGKGK